ncbi:hypothetical protein KCU64_g20374, partial [Aureobasidium melanogenum]
RDARAKDEAEQRLREDDDSNEVQLLNTINPTLCPSHVSPDRRRSILLLLTSRPPDRYHSIVAMDQAKLQRLQNAVRIGMNSRHSVIRGTPRRKVKKVNRSGGGDDKKLQAALKKMNVQPIPAIEEVNMFKSDGNVIHFAAPKVHAAIPSNTFAIYGNGEDKELTELVPGILNQLGPDSL